MKRTLRILVGLIFLVSLSTLALAADLVGMVTDAGGNPMETKILLKDSTGAPVGQGVATDKKGGYAFKDIKPGAYQLSINKQEWKIFVGPGETRRDLQVK